MRPNLPHQFMRQRGKGRIGGQIFASPIYEVMRQREDRGANI